MSFAVSILLPFLLAMATSVVACRLARAAFARLTLVDRAGSEAHKQQAGTVPHGGGVGMAVAIAATLLVAAGWFGSEFLQSGDRSAPLWPLAVSAGCLFALGQLDDRRPLSPWLKLAVQFLAVGVTVAGCDLGIDALRSFPVLSYGLAAVWIVLVTNAFNLLDHADGLSATTAVISIIVLVSAALMSGDLHFAVVYLAVMGALAGFLVWNLPPAKMYMGDAGSLPLGFMIGSGCLVVTFWDSGADEGTGLAVLAPLLVTAIPLYDTAVVMIKRLRHRRRMMTGDRNHISHRLNRLGLSPRSSLAAVAALQTGLAASALLLRSADLTTGLVVVLQASSVLLAAILLEARRDRFA